MLQSKGSALSGLEQGPAWTLPGGGGQGPSAFSGEREMADGNSNFHSVNQKGVRRLTVETQIYPALLKAMISTKPLALRCR